ncbi:hypothetical protein [Sphingomonas sp.]|uniref:hypothetical protein n=1 Tax=Sphingomonas sp. TaxID=28214 RepID=UPI0028B201FE|nr:hypothetical protein [Sphingomonas sp.]
MAIELPGGSLVGAGGKFRLLDALPGQLPALRQGVPVSIRTLWLSLLLMVAAIQLAGLGYVLIDTYRINPALRALGFEFNFDEAGLPALTVLRSDIAAAGVGEGDRIVAVAGRRLPPSASTFTVGRAILAAPGTVVALVVRKKDGREIEVRASRSSHAHLARAPNPIPVDVRICVRLFFTLLCSASLLGSSCLLLYRRPRDPEALLLGLGFLTIAACVDPPLLMWMSLGVGWVIDVLTGIWWAMLVVAIAAFPNGQFTPPWLRWSMIVAPVLGVVLMNDRLDQALALSLGLGVPLLLIAAQIIRYRRLEPGLERQQIKWAALGFATAFALVGAALIMSLAPYDHWSTWAGSMWLIGTVCLFNLGFAVMPLGLLIALIRYRLWNVDQVLSNSVAYTVVAGAIVLLWSLLSDVAKQVVASLLGPENATLGLAVGAVVATSVFVPTQRVVLKWSKQRFDRSSIELEELPARLGLWAHRCNRSEIAARTLDIVMGALHASGGALLARTPTGHALLAKRGARVDELVPSSLSYSSDTVRHIGGHVLHLADEEGLAGWMILLPRDDDSPFPRSQLKSLSAAAASIANALRSAEPEALPEAAPRHMLDELRERLEKLERSRPKTV